jgi:hypothetical protein
MKRYSIISSIMLTFLGRNDSIDCMIDPGEIILESDGHTIWAIENNNRVESITMANAINIWLNQNKIKEICLT